MSDFQFNLIWLSLVWLLADTEKSRAGKIILIILITVIAGICTLLELHFQK